MISYQDAFNAIKQPSQPQSATLKPVAQPTLNLNQAVKSGGLTINKPTVTPTVKTAPAGLNLPLAGMSNQPSPSATLNPGTNKGIDVGNIVKNVANSPIIKQVVKAVGNQGIINNPLPGGKSLGPTLKQVAPLIPAIAQQPFRDIKSAELSLVGQKDFNPVQTYINPLTGKTETATDQSLMFGKEPIKNLQGNVAGLSKTAQGVGVPKGIADIGAIPLTGVMMALDFLPAGAEKEVAAETLNIMKKASTVEEATKLLDKASPAVKQFIDNMFKDKNIPINSVQDLFNQVKNTMPGFSSGAGGSEAYLKSLIKGQETAAKVDKGGIIQKGQNFLADVKAKLVDSTTPIEDTLGTAQKTGKYKVLPASDIHYQIDRTLRSNELGASFIHDNGMTDVIKNVPDLHTKNDGLNVLDQYLIAKHAPEVASAGFTTGRNVQADAQLVKDLAPTYEPYAQKVVQFGQKLLDKAVETGLVSKENAAMLKQKYPNYVPLERIFNELEKTAIPEGVGGGVASLSKQTVVKSLQGSERAIQNPIETLLTKTLDVFSQGERNQAGQMLASYKDLPGNPFSLRELKIGETATHTISYLDNGVKKTFETTPEIAAAAKFLDKRQLGLIGNIAAFPLRIARIGITGINVPFLLANVAKDQVSAFINSNHALQTSLINPKIFAQALFDAVGHGKGYEEWVKAGAGGTSFDLSRSAPGVSIAKLRSTKNIGSSIAYTITNPKDWIRTVENIVNRGEELTRIQQYKGTKAALLAQGRTPQDAEILAAAASRENTVNFARSGDWGKALNSVFLYLNAGIQGSRTLLRNLQQRPIQTASKIAISTFFPVAATTAWNLGSPDRAAAYNDIRTSEKDGNIIIIPPNPEKDPITGKWKVYKIPLSQEIANLTVPVRQSIEGMYGVGGTSFTDVAEALLGTGTSLNINGDNPLLTSMSQLTPQAIKPGMEAALNKNLFSGADIVPQYLGGKMSKNLPPEKQVYKNTSGTARLISKPLNISPLKTEQFVKSTLGGVGSQVINASDQLLAAGGLIPKEQIGGQSIPQGIIGRFYSAAGGQLKANKAAKKKTSIGTSIKAYQ